MSRNEVPASVPTAPYTATKEYISAWSNYRVLHIYIYGYTISQANENIVSYKMAIDICSTL